MNLTDNEKAVLIMAANNEIVRIESKIIEGYHAARVGASMKNRAQLLKGAVAKLQE